MPLAAVVTRLLSITSERLEKSEDVPDDWQNTDAMLCSYSKRPWRKNWVTMSWWGQWHNSVPETVVGTNEGQAGPWEQLAWICQGENLPDLLY